MAQRDIPHTGVAVVTIFLAREGFFIYSFRQERAPPSRGQTFVLSVNFVKLGMVLADGVPL